MSKLSKLREYRTGDIAEFLRTEYRQVIRALDLAFRSLTFKENFGGFEWNGTIAAGATVEIRNLLKPVTPSGRLVLRSQFGLIVDGPTWTSETVSLKNLSASQDTVTVVFLP